MYKNKKSLQETHPNLAAEWHPTKNGDLTPNDVTAGSNKKVWWLLPYDDPNTGKHFDFEWQAIISNRKTGRGCPFISGQTIWFGFNDLATIHPDLAKEWHPTKNGVLKPNNITVSSGKKVWWLLPYDDPESGKHFNFEWQASVANRTDGCGCPYLSGHAVWKGYNDLSTTHPELAAEWHPTKNGSLKPENVTAYSRKKVWWLLPYDDPNTGKHFNFEWEATIHHRANGSGCPYLSGKIILKGFNDLATTHPELAAEWHPTKNNSLTPNDISAGINKRVWWHLPYDDSVTGKHFDFEWQSPISIRVNGTGCPFLSGHAVWKSFNDLATTHPELAAQWHPAKNGNLTPNDITFGSCKKVYWLCPTCGYEWPADIRSRAKGRACPLCSSSQGEKEIYNLLQVYSINFVKEHSFPDCKYKNTLRFDFAIFDKNNNLVFLIEYDGEQHSTEKTSYFHKYKSYENCQKRDAVKNQYCKNNNIPLLRISYENFNKIEDIVIAELKKYNLI